MDPQAAIEAAFAELDERDLATISDSDRAIVERALPHTMTGVLRVLAVVEAVRYVVRAGVEGDFAECGVWRGGSVIAMIETLKELGADARDIHLYDTFEGMTEPSEADTSPLERPALEHWQETGGRPWPEFFAPEVFDEAIVRETILATGYPAERLHFVRGRVEDTIPDRAPECLALVRLDTDWYESTMHELVQLWPRLARGGVLLVDDYGAWDGCRRAVDEYFTHRAAPVLLHRTDFTGRTAVKV